MKNLLFVYAWWGLLLVTCVVGTVTCDDRNGGEMADLKEEMDALRQELRNTLSEMVSRVEGISTKLDDVTKYMENMENHFDEVGGLQDMPLENYTSPFQSAAVGSTTYIRWGRNVCGTGGTFVYTGVVGGADASKSGSASSLLCLPLDPDYEDYLDGTQLESPGRAAIVGAEYKGDPDAIFDFSNNAGLTFLDEDVPCSMCLLENTTVTVMIPAQTICPLGWSRVYWGYLMGAKYDGPYASSFKCIDHSPEVVMGGSGTTGISTGLYHTEGYCASPLPCPNYIDSWELTCVVCTR